jgi:hypothetical protein
MLQPISKRSGGPAWERNNVTSRDFVIATYDGARPTCGYRDYRFSTFVYNFQAMYFELWKRNEEDERYWYLDRAFLTIYQMVSGQEKEFLCLHCEPNLSFEQMDLENKYKNATNNANLQINNRNIGSKANKKQLRDQVGGLGKPDKGRYKKGPHLHIKAATDPLPHAHFALNLGHLDAVLESIESLSEALRCGILMIKEEVLDRYTLA